MIGIGTIVNTAAIIAGGLVGMAAGRHLGKRFQETVVSALATSVMFVGVAGTIQEMLKAGNDGRLVSHGALMFVISLAAGGILGEILDIDGRLERFGIWIRKVTRNENDSSFVNAFVMASLTFCIGAMAIVGAIQDGLKGDPSILYLKSVMDGCFTVVLVVSLGKGAVFSAIPIFIFQGGITLASRLLEPVFTPEALSNLSYVGNLLIFCVGWNLIHGEKKIRVANLLPALIIAVIWAFVF